MAERPSALAPRTPADLARRIANPVGDGPLVDVDYVVDVHHDGSAVYALACGHEVTVITSSADLYTKRRARCRECAQ